MKMRAWMAAVLLAAMAAVIGSCGGVGGRGTSTPPDESGGGSADDGGDAAEDGAIIADQGAASAFTDVPADYINQAKTNLRVLYGRTLYGMQIDTGMELLNAEDPSLYPLENNFFVVDITNNDLDSLGDPGAWDQVTARYYQ